jgi:hypothetical protein
MKNCSAALQAHLSGNPTSVAYIWKVKRTDGTILGFTTHDVDIVYDDGSGDSSITYLASNGFTNTASSNKSDLTPANLEVTGFLVSDDSSIKEEDLRYGLYDNALIQIRLVNWADLTMGDMILHTGTLGVVKMKNGLFTAELRGLAYKLTTILGGTYGPICRATFGSGTNGIGTGSETVLQIAVFAGGTGYAVGDTGTLFYGDNNATYLVTAVSGGIVSGIQLTNGGTGYTPLATQVATETGGAQPGSGTGLTVLMYVDLSGRDQWLCYVNVVNYQQTGSIANPISPTTLAPTAGLLQVGSATPTAPAPADWFDNGLITFTSGILESYTFEIKSWDGTNLELFLPLLQLPAAGDTFVIEPGCDHTTSDCQNKYGNIINFRGEDTIPGMDNYLAYAGVNPAPKNLPTGTGTT